MEVSTRLDDLLSKYVDYEGLKVINPLPSSDKPARVVDDNFRIIADKFDGLRVVHHGTADIIEEYVASVSLPTEVWDLPVNLTVIVGGKGYMVEKTLDRDGIMVGFIIVGQNGTKFDYIVISTSGSDFCEYIALNPT